MDKRSEMPVLKFTLMILAIAGCWRPISWTSLFRLKIYNVYAIFVFLTLYTFSMSQFAELVFKTNADSDAFNDSLFSFLISLLACYKTFVIQMNRESITMLINYLTERPFKPIDLNERIIRQKFDKRITKHSLCYFILIVISASYLIGLSLYTNFKNGLLMYKAWIPFDYSIAALFNLVYTHQMLSFMYLGLIHATSDSFICGLLLHVCCQIEILEYRLSNIIHGRGNLRDCVRHHIHIYEYSYILNENFSKIVPGEFIMIIIVMCYDLIRVTLTSSHTTFMQSMMLISSTLTALFNYCWFGNETRMKSLQLSNNIYNMEWMFLNIDIKKGFLMIMNRATIPIEFRSTNIMPMNLESFVMVLKTSYSLFNVLIQTRKH